MAKAAHDPAFAKERGISQEVAKEFHAADVKKGRQCSICKPTSGKLEQVT